MPGRSSTARTEPAGRATSSARNIRLHAWAYIAGASVLIAVNSLSAGSWWSFWPIAAWGVALTVHYLVYKARTVNEGWAEERAANLRSKSYDASHMDTIARDFGGKTADRDKK